MLTKPKTQNVVPQKMLTKPKTLNVVPQKMLTKPKTQNVDQTLTRISESFDAFKP